MILKLEYLSNRNFPDINIDKVQIKSSKVIINCNIYLYSIADTLLLDGEGELCIGSTSNIPLKFFKKNEQWFEVEKVGQLKEVYILICNQESKQIIIEGENSQEYKIRIQVDDAFIKFT